MSDASYPKEAAPPRRVHVDRRCRRSNLLGRRTTLDPRRVVFMVVVGLTPGMRRRSRWTIEARRRTGHITESLVRW